MAKYESPDYTIMDQHHDIEIRQYDAFSTSMVQETNLRGSSGFGVLFRYISGDNDNAQPISMTIPVFSERSEQPTMEFVIPKDVVAAGIPSPNNPNVSIKHYDPQTYAVLRFRGKIYPEKLTAKEQQLRQWLSAQAYTITGPARLAQYDGPYIPPFFRTNEILLPVTTA
jgi:effector-binding domain-containing protein